jgi:hypothetical protein
MRTNTRKLTRFALDVSHTLVPHLPIFSFSLVIVLQGPMLSPFVVKPVCFLKKGRSAGTKLNRIQKKGKASFDLPADLLIGRSYRWLLGSEGGGRLVSRVTRVSDCICPIEATPALIRNRPGTHFAIPNLAIRTECRFCALYINSIKLSWFVLVPFIQARFSEKLIPLAFADLFLNLLTRSAE